jgi:hypothetical protein
VVPIQDKVDFNKRLYFANVNCTVLIMYSVCFSPHTIDISKRRVHLHLHRVERRWRPQHWEQGGVEFLAPAAEALSVIAGATSPCAGAPSPISASLLSAHRGQASERHAVVPTSEHHRTSFVTTVSDSALTRSSSVTDDLGQLQAAGPQGGSSGQCQNDGVLHEELH